MSGFRIGVFTRRTSAAEGGADTLVRTIAARLQQPGVTSGIELVPVPWAAWSQRRQPFRYAARRLLQRFGKELPDVDLRALCREWRLDAAYFTTPAFVRIDVPFIFTLWDLGHRTLPQFPEMRRGPWSAAYRDALYREMLGRAAFTVVGNEAGAAEAREHYGVPAERLVPVPFPNPEFADVAEAAPGWLPAGPFFLYPAQFWPHKNHAVLLAALRRAAQAGRPLPPLVLVGSDKGHEAAVRRRVSELGLEANVVFGGFVSRSELKALYRRARGLVFPSLLGPNNLPPQEAAVLGCPMILSDLAGHREQLGDGALYAAGADAGAWQDAMQRLGDDPALAGALVERARVAVAGCTAEAYVGRIVGLMQQLAKGAAP